VLQIQDAAGVSVLNVATNTVYSPSAPTLTSASTGGTQPAGTYYYELAALSTNGTTTAVASSPSSVTTTGSTSVNTLTWSTVTGATGYMVYRSINGGTTWFTTEVPSGTTSITDNGSTYNWSSSAY
jgi:hypothetical protein